MESNLRYYARRAAIETSAAARALTPQAQSWHRRLAEQFAGKAREHSESADAA